MSEKTPIMELRRIKKYFPVKRKVNLHALENISFKIYEGEKFGVVGESGCGKSTLGRVILQLYKPTSGSCVYYGRSIEEFAPKYLAKEIKKLPEYQKNAVEYQNKYLELTNKIAQMKKNEDDGTNRKVKELQDEAEECRKNVYRHLREGSRTVGSLILSKKLPEIQKLYEQAHKSTLEAHAANQKYSKLNAELNKHIVEQTQLPIHIKQEAEVAQNEMKKYREKAAYIRQEALKYRGKDILAITDRCLETAYWDKLDSNYESGINLTKLTNSEMRTLRRDMQMIFQDPAASLDPRQSVGKAVEEMIVVHTNEESAVRKEKVMKLFERVGLKSEHYYSFPHALSGGQKQRVGIARAIALDSKFIVLDEAVSALDVSVQAQILLLLNELCENTDRTYFFITHDLGVVKHFCDRILVMYLGNICELADSKTLFNEPLHPYTKSLLASVPRPVVKEKGYTEDILEGEVPSAVDLPTGCTFHTRCKECMEICKTHKPEFIQVAGGRFVACHLHTDEYKSEEDKEENLL